MKVRTQLIAGLVIFALLLAFISGLVITTNQQVDQLVAQERIANEIALEVGELGYLSNDFILYREPQQVQRWEAKYASLSDLIAGLSVEPPEQRAIVRNLAADLRNTRSVFGDIVSNPVQPGGTDTEFAQLSWSRMAVQNQGMVFDAVKLATSLGDQADELRQARNLFIFALTGAFVVFLLTSYFLFSRRTLKSIADLQEGARIIGSGNLDYTIEVKGDDEISALSQSFNRMTSDLRRVIATKADLEWEIAGRKQAEEELIRANAQLGHSEQNLIQQNIELNALNEELTATQEELEQNIHELTRAETELQRLAEQRQVALDAARMGWWHYDPITRTGSWDERYREIFDVIGYQGSNDEILATRMHPEDLPGVWASVEAALDPVHPQFYSAEYRINLPDGSVRWIEAHGIASFEGNGENRRATRLVGTVADITDRKQAEGALKEASKKLNLLTSITRHDILNQITALKAFLVLLEDLQHSEGGAREMFHNVETIADTIRRQITFTGDYQDMGERDPEWQHVEWVVMRAAASVRRNGAALTVTTGSLEIFADPMLEKAFYNLLDNAVVHGEGVTNISVSFRNEADAGVLVFEDEGVGVPASMKDDIFQRGVGKITGYGLFLVKEILDITGMSIRETGEEKKGARFEIEVPAGKWRIAEN